MRVCETAKSWAFDAQTRKQPSERLNWSQAVDLVTANTEFD
jgi:hypothetical protein